MAGPIVFWPNRKSKNGLRRAVSKKPRGDRRRFFTVPPVARPEFAMRSAARMKLVKGMTADRVKAVSDLADALDAFDRDRIFQAADRLVRAACAHDEILQKDIDDAYGSLKILMGEQATLKAEIRGFELEVERMAEDVRIKTDELRRLHAERDPDKIQLQIMYAVDERCAAKDSPAR